MQKLSVSSIASSFSLPNALIGVGLSDSEFSAGMQESEFGVITKEFGGCRGDMPAEKNFFLLPSKALEVS